MKSNKSLSLAEEVDKKSHEIEMSQDGIANSSPMEFVLYCKRHNPTDITCVLKVIEAALDDLVAIGGHYLNEIAKKVPERDVKKVIDLTIAYSSVVAHLKSFNEKKEICTYFLDKKVPECFKKN